MRLPRTEWQERRGMQELLEALRGDQGDTRYVGGCVRDALLGLAASDVDLATRLEPEEVMRCLRAKSIKVVPTGLAHGTVTAVLNGVPIEVTSLRRDVTTDGRRATIAFTSDWKEDAARRDFTINALTADPASGEIFDYFQGLEDLQAGRVRFIGDPLQRIAEDHLRILRFFRFHARFGRGEPDADALQGCAARANDLMALSRERIADELLKLLGLPSPQPAVALMVKHGILKSVLPEIRSEGVARLSALIDRERLAGVAADAVRRLAALLPADEELAANVAARLRFSRKIAKRLRSAASRQEDEVANPRLLAYRIGVEEAIDHILLGHGDPVAVEKLSEWERPRLLIGGGDLIAMGLAAGPVVARTLQAIEREWAQEGFAPEKEMQRALALRHVDQALRTRQ
ncbi:CCA tRNA nucleotidyltransferase [Sphingosinicella rhizophila]|uniref:CCA tRNA nucleotidyltransferase n=1 Tax=Sphingosinicella rhizophila TaxID=3050082 RepID=A0ABU3Q3U9_9SPHN|nr:CCA tRNA nucleotidyltransferase [Sphingosinicella sp. GR2756]MDT9598076.1 CCA tRNA nucleotidyltransferase [Sphingosinicella sp. GR2756]